nr:reverse transcriptase domain-containing protein [Tanacetum cinerariifolium]
MSAMANTTPIVTIVTKPTTNPRDADATPRVNIQDFCEEYYEEILPIIMDKVRRDKRKEVHARPERLKVQDRLRYNDRYVLDRLSHRRQSTIDRLSKTYSPSTTKSRPGRTSSRDHPHDRSRPHKLNASNKGRLENKEHFRSIRKSYDDSHSHSYHDRDRSRHMKRRRASESPLSSVSRSDSSDGRYQKSKSKRHKPTDEDDLTMPWICEEQNKYVKDPIEIHNIKQKDGETIEDFMERFKVESRRMKGAHECMRISGFMHGVNNPELTKRLNEHVPKTMEEMMIATTTFIRGKAAVASKKKGHTSWRTHDQSKRQTLKKRTTFEPPPPMVTPVEKRSSNKFCDFHNDKRHSTDERMQLKKQIEELVRAGMLLHLIKEFKHGQDQSKVGKKETLAKDKPATIYMIHGVEGPLVIEAEISEHMIHRLYVDGGSSMEILYKHCFNRLRPEVKNQMVLATTSLTGFNEETIWPLGQIRLLVTLGDTDQSTRAWMNFMIVRSLSPYNGIIGRPRIKEIQALPSTAHEMLKFPVDGGIVTIRSTILIPAECATVIPSSEENLDIFAWKPSDMTGVPQSVAEHQLNIREGYSPVRQKKMGQALKRAKAIQAEVQKLVEAGIMREVYYHDWLSNPVMIQLVESDEEKMAFHTVQGVYCHTKMPFGLKNAGATYQRLVDKAFNSQINQNIEVYVDDLVVKSHTEAVMLRDIGETFRTLRKINMKLNHQKCTFGAVEGMFLGYMVTLEGIKSCPKLYYNYRLYGQSKRSKTSESEQAFKQLKQHLSELPLLAAPKPKEELFVYLSASYRAISTVLMTERGAAQMPVYFVSHTLQGPEFNYTPIEKLNLSLVFAANRLGMYFQAHPIESVMLGEHNITYRPRTLVKGHVQADFLAEMPDESLSRNTQRKIHTRKGGDNRGRRRWTDMDDSIMECLKEGTLPSDRKEARKLRIKARREIHEGSCSMYVGPRSVVAKAIRLGYYWPTMHRDARYMIRTCKNCQGIDIAGPFPEVPGKVKFLIVAMDYFMKLIEVKDVATITDGQVKKFVWDNIVCRFVKHQQSSGLVERANRSLGEGIKARLGEGNKNWVEELPYVLWAHRTMIKTRHGDTPFSLTYGIEAIIPVEIGMPTYHTATVDVVHNDEELRLNLDLLEERRERAAIFEAKSKLKLIKSYNARVCSVTFRIGDFVYRINDASHAVDGGKLGPKWEGPYKSCVLVLRFVSCDLALRFGSAFCLIEDLIAFFLGEALPNSKSRCVLSQSKKQVTVTKPSDRQDSNKNKHVVTQKIQKTNVPVPHSTGVKRCPKAGGSQPKSNHKTNRISSAKGDNKLPVEDLPRTNKSYLRTTNRVDSNSRLKRTVINSNSDSICQTCNKCLTSFYHDMCVAVYVKSVVLPHSTRHNCEVERKIKQVWKPKLVGKVWKPTGKVLTTIGHQWRPTGQILHLGTQCPLTRFTAPQVVVQIVLWYLDSDCSKHITGDRSRLLNFVKKFIGTVRFRNDHFGAIMGYGNYVVGKSVISRKTSCYVRDTNGVDLIKGSRGTNFYTISVEDMMKSSLICLFSKASKNKSWLWHRRLNHLNFGTINDLARKDLVRGLPRLKFEKDHLCSACQLGKSKKQTHKPKAENTNSEVLNTLHMDLCDPIRVQTINGKKYILVIVDDYSRFTWVKFLRSKDETSEVVIKFITQIQVGLNKTVRYVRTDNGTEFVNHTVTEYYERIGIFHQNTVPRTPQQNGVVERRNRTLVEAARTMLIFSKALMFLWIEAVATACYTQNCSLIHSRHHKTPYELVHNKKPDLTFFRVFGALCYPTNNSEDLGKLQPTADTGIFVGYAPSRKG